MMMKCPSCAHRWFEGKAIDITQSNKGHLPTTIDQDCEADVEIRRLVEATRDAQEAFAANRHRRVRQLAGWSSLAVAVLSSVLVAAAYPEALVTVAPATVTAFAAIGKSVNIYGLDLRRVELQHLTVDGTRILAIKGEIANISGDEKKIPWLRFGLRNDRNQEIYSWTIDAGARPLQSGEMTNFVTRLASPPGAAEHVEIRFAHRDEISSNSGL